MRVRHRVPSIFNLSMVDVLCCALGCVILLWLLNLREAKEHEDSAREVASRGAALLAGTEEERDLAYRMLDEIDRGRMQAESGLDRARQRIAELTEASKDLTERLQRSNSRSAVLERDAAAASVRAKALQSIADTVPALRAELTEAKERAANEEALAHSLEKDVAKKIRELTDAGKTLQVMQAAKQSLERELAGKAKDLDRADSYRERWAASAGRVSELEKQLKERSQSADAARQAIELLEEDKKALRAEANRYRQSADNRFAGIELTGKRVVFLVDMSGSMELVDDTTAAPQKWLEVRQTLAKIMRSLPELSQFQVIIFSDRARFLLGEEDRWLDYDAKTSPDRILNALAAIKPIGGTDMYAAFDAAFRFRRSGLDTIYLLSDGLPNLGEGIAPEQARTLKEVDQSEILGKYIRNKLRREWNPVGQGRQRVRINAVGFFFESPDVGAFLWALARENDGSFVGMSKP